MKNLGKFFKKTSVFIAVSVTLTILLMFIIGMFLILPAVGSLSSSQVEKAQLKIQQENLEKSISITSSYDLDEINKFERVINNFLPEEKDTLRFIVLAQLIADFSGVSIDTLETKIDSTVVPTQPASPGAEASPPETQGVGSGGQLVGTVSNTVANSFVLKMTVGGTFGSIQKFIGNFQKPDRLIRISELVIAGEEDELTATVTFELPLGSKITSVNPGEDIQFTLAERESIQDIINNIKFSVTSAGGSLGKANPFK